MTSNTDELVKNATSEISAFVEQTKEPEDPDERKDITLDEKSKIIENENAHSKMSFSDI